ncbi:Flp pilus assembly protein CpaB [Mycobacterium tuberculosis]|nr:Flp pilus assembly protein CpaB [Mycobacterium tuberculosis]
MSPRLARLRRPLASLFAAAAAGLALLALRPGPPPSVRVLAAARDLPAGTTLTAADLHHVDLPPPAVPSGAFRSSAAGRVLAGPMRKGEPLTDARVLGDALLKGYGPDTVATPLRIADPAAVHLLHPGDRIDVLSTPPAGPDDPPSPEPPTAQLPTDRTLTAHPRHRPPKSTRTNTPSFTALATLLTTRPPTHTTALPATPPMRASSLPTAPLPTAPLPRIRTAPEWRGARVVASGVPVVAIPPPRDDDGQEGALIVLATGRAQALALAAATPPLSLTITGS